MAARQYDGNIGKLNVNTTNKIRVELYDLENDPSEKNDIAAKFAGVVKKMMAMMKKAHVANKDWPLLPEELK
jgi:hypothetical protein